jgi:hypothetical protein
MTTIATTNSLIGAEVAALLSGGANASAPAPAASQPASPSSASTNNPDFGPATNVNLSDHAKAVLARAKSDEVVASRLQAFVEAHRIQSKGDIGNRDDADSAGRTTGRGNQETPSLGDFTGQDGTIYGVIVTPTEPGSAVLTAVPTVDPKISFSSQLQAGGFTISATADASTGTYSMQIDGPDGFHWSDQKLNPGPGLDSTTGAVPAGGLIMSGAGPGNIETINFSEDSATAASVTASSDAGSLSVTEATARALAATVTIDFSTGTIKISGSSATATSQSASLNLSA